MPLLILLFFLFIVPVLGVFPAYVVDYRCKVNLKILILHTPTREKMYTCKMYNACARNRLHYFLHISIGVTCRFRHFILSLQKEQVCETSARFLVVPPL